jgi:hypothetical protein
MKRMRVLVAGAVLVAVSASACASHLPTSRARAGRCYGLGSAPVASGRPVSDVSWPERRMGPASPEASLSGMAVDPAAETAYELISKTSTPSHGPYLLECVDLRNGATLKGPILNGTTSVAPNIAVAAGYLWLSAFPGRRAHISQVDLRSLRVIRSIHLPGAAIPAATGIRLAAGPAGSIWAGSVQAGGANALLRLDVHTDAVLATAKLPASLAATSLALDPSGRFLYVSATHIVGGGVEGNVVLEYDARSGRRLAEAAHGLVTAAVFGAALSAVPDGVWASFRTGMMGLTLHLRQRDLAMIAPTGPGFARSPSRSLFRWAMYATTIYGGGDLWFASQEGMVACLDPRTGRPLAEEHVPERLLVFQLLAADPATRHLYGADAGGLVGIRPPGPCWRSAALAL